ncbi:hypothetical protein Taro_025279 [Colocasia esculenta]|uniref:Uncharacterized protein n=1 Tax=Colocasia esculenta TaxID=4460 RepID=A0A843V8H5_COLES|nr:hypothetical protein [Colocasia esculenta]
MESLPSPLGLLPSPVVNTRVRHPGVAPSCRRGRPLRPVSTCRSGGGPGWREPSGRSLVDEGMVQLRRRIREIKEEEAPEHWAEWEKRYYRGYHADVCEAVGLLQNVLMGTRPGVALAVAALVALSVPTSAAVVVFHLVEAVNRILF